MSVAPITVKREGKRVLASWTFADPGGRKAVSAELALSYGAPGNWRCRAWRLLPATIAGNTCTVELPSSPLPYYIYGSVIDGTRGRNSTPLVFPDLKALGLLDAKAGLPIDGCAEWGGFEPGQISFLRNQGMPCPDTAAPGKEGAQAALLPAGKTTSLMRPYCIAGLSHRLTAWVRAEKPTTVTLRLAGQFDNSQRMAEDTFPVTTEWTHIAMDLPTKNGLWTDLQFTATAPAGSAVLMDAVSFTPAN